MPTKKQDDQIRASRARLDLAHIRQRGRQAGSALAATGFAVAKITPGDATGYGFMIVDQERHQRQMGGCRFIMGSTFGRINGLPDPLGRADHGYIAEKFIERIYRNVHTSVVYVEFIEAVGEGWRSA